MARVTVEDCIDKVNDRFELVILAAYRANGINSGIPITVEREKDKYSVIALREIAAETIKIPTLREALIKHFQVNIKPDKIDDENLHTEIESGDEIDYMPDNDNLYTDEDLMDMDIVEEDNFADNAEDNEEQ